MVLQAIYNLNLEVFRIVDSVANPTLNQLMPYLLESFYLVLPLIAVYLYFKRDANVYSFVATAVLLYAIGEAIKLIVAEPRPCSAPDLSFINQIGCEAGYSFPSEHATVLTGLYLFLDNYKYLRPLYIIWLIGVLFGKLYLGQHYFTDIIAGVILSLVLAKAVHRFRSQINNRMREALISLFRLVRLA